MELLEMPRCPNCSYVLVALKDSQKCKCARCGRLFFKKAAESKEFRTWNVKQREIDKHNLKLETKQRKQRPELTPGEVKLRLEKCRVYCQNHYEKNKDKILQKKKIYRQLAKEKQNQRRKAYRQKLINRTRLLARISYFRIKQAELAQQETKMIII